MKKILFLICVLCIFFAQSQKYFAKNGIIHFESSVPIFEDIDAKSSTAMSVLNSDTGEIAVVSIVKNYKFKVGLMEEHFNENYAESSKYPKANFIGKIQNFKKSELSETPKNYIISGILSFHGVDNKISTAASISLKDGNIIVTGKFVTKAADYKVTIPKMVSKKIAENVNVDYQFILIKQ